VTPPLTAIARKIDAGDPLTPEDTRALEATRDLIGLGMMAELVRRRRHGDRATFVRVAVSGPGSAATGTAIPEGAGELRLAGPFADPGELVERARTASDLIGDRPLSVASLADLGRVVDGVAAFEGLAAELRTAGVERVALAEMDVLPDLTAWLEPLTRAGIAIGAFGLRLAPSGSQVDQLEKVRELHASTGLVRAYAPLPAEAPSDRPSTGYDDVRAVALARLLLTDVESIQVSWATYGPKLAQVALLFGADELDAVPAEASPDLGPRRTPWAEVRRNIAEAGFAPEERDGRLQPVG